MYNALAEEPEMKKVRVVLADDHAMVREGTRRILEREPDIEVVGEASDGEELIQRVRELEPDMVVLDMAMPKVGGVEATQRLKALFPSIAVLALSAYDDDAYVFAVLEAGAAGYLLKNVRGSELVEAIRAVRDGESVLHPTVARKVLHRLTHAPGKTGEETDHGLTRRELEVLRLAGQGMSNKEISTALTVSVRTVQSHFGNIFGKLNVGSRTEAVIWAMRRGLIKLNDVH
ncbi:MAG: response regulator transcription factor [Chloroflexi bacterium]|nr:response regulator transcription factor [Chloroflexota bacterium]